MKNNKAAKVVGGWWWIVNAQKIMWYYPINFKCLQKFLFEANILQSKEQQKFENIFLAGP